MPFIQALSNSVWALAHMRGRPSELDAVACSPGLTMHFMLGVASCALEMLRGLRTRSDPAHVQASMMQSEKRFSCQVRAEALKCLDWRYKTTVF